MPQVSTLQGCLLPLITSLHNYVHFTGGEFVEKFSIPEVEGMQSGHMHNLMQIPLQTSVLDLSNLHKVENFLKIGTESLLFFYTIPLHAATLYILK